MSNVSIEDQKNNVFSGHFQVAASKHEKKLSNYLYSIMAARWVIGFCPAFFAFISFIPRKESFC